jgi:hypothetical protein
MTYLRRFTSGTGDFGFLSFAGRGTVTLWERTLGLLTFAGFM